MDTTNCNLSKIGSKIIAIPLCKTWNRILKACIALKPEGDEKWKSRNSINYDQLCLTSTRHLWKIYRKWKFQNFQIYGFNNFVRFKFVYEFLRHKYDVCATCARCLRQGTRDATSYRDIQQHLYDTLTTLLQVLASCTLSQLCSLQFCHLKSHGSTNQKRNGR